MRERWRAYVVSVAVVVLVGSPLLGFFAGDSFPVSTYPMFARARGTEVSLPHVVVVRADGSERPATPSEVANDEVIQAVSTLRQAIRAGEDATGALCARVASRVGDGAAEVRVVTSRYDAVAYYTGERAPLGQTVHVTCPVGR